ncbi:MAG TPA: 4Fe-4S ferredoxin [Clostridia bacterium]|nr:4Fe-4S ferredoxin [Clostridia bacterium]
MSSQAEALTEVERQRMEVDIACVGFGPAMGGFLTTLSRALTGDTPIQSAAAPGLPLQVICYERADDIGFGVSGVVTRARGIRASFPELDPAQIPMAAPVRSEKVLYLLDPHGASRRSPALRFGDAAIRTLKAVLPYEQSALVLPYTPPFLRKHDGLVMSIGQFNQWVGSQLMSSAAVQIWPAMPVAEPLTEGDCVAGIRLCDQGVDRSGAPDACYMAGMDVRARLTVVGDGPVGPVGQSLDARFGMPEGHEHREWALGMKMVVELPEDTPLEPGTVFHTFGYPEPEIFGFFYVHPDRLASVGIFIPSWLPNPSRTAYRYLQHYMQHPYFWRYLKGGTLRSWGAKSLQESGRAGEPFLAGNGYARIGEGSGSTNVLTGSGVDEAWTTGTLLGEAVVELLREGKPFTRENLETTYISRRRSSWLERESQIAEHSRSGFQSGVVLGLIGMALAGFTKGNLFLCGDSKRAHEQVGKLEKYYSKLSKEEIEAIRADSVKSNVPLHDVLMDACGWPAIECDGRLLITHQDALLMGGKVQAAGGYADHVVFTDARLCERCADKSCVEMCSGQAITRGDGAVPAFDREKCVHCGACLWNCSQSPDGVHSNIQFRAGAGGLHSAEN